MLDHLQRAKKPEFHSSVRAGPSRPYHASTGANTLVARRSQVPRLPLGTACVCRRRARRAAKTAPGGHDKEESRWAHHRVSRTAALALTLAALGASTAAAQQQDLRSPDTRDTGRTAPTAAQQQDLRSPDTRDPARAATDPLAQERYYSSYGTPDSSAAIAQERYLSSYGEPEPLTLPQSPVPSDGPPWLSIALSIAGALVIVAASATQLRRLRLRRRRAVRSTA